MKRSCDSFMILLSAGFTIYAFLYFFAENVTSKIEAVEKRFDIFRYINGKGLL